MRVAHIRCALNLHAYHNPRLCNGHRRLVYQEHMATSREIGRISGSFEIEKELSPPAEVLPREPSVAHFFTV